MLKRGRSSPRSSSSTRITRSPARVATLRTRCRAWALSAVITSTTRCPSYGRDVIPRRLTAPPPGWTTSADVVVIGSGIAGLTAALRCRQALQQRGYDDAKVLLVTKALLDAGSTRWAQGGIAAALSDDDSPDAHYADTITAGAGLCDPSAVRVLVDEGPAQVHALAALGADFDRGQDGALEL